MARLTFFALAAAMALAAISAPQGVAAEASGLSNISPVPAADLGEVALDDDGKPIEFLTDVDDTDFDDILGEDEDEEDPVKRHHHKHHHNHHHKGHKKHKHRHSRHKLHITTGPQEGDSLLFPSIKATWYAAHDLLNPACGNGGHGWQPTSRSHVGAVKVGWGPKCGEFVRVCATGKKNRCVKLRVVDQCAGCDENWIDMSKAAFLQLATGGLDQGEVHHLKVYKTKKPNPYAIPMFGPLRLRA